VSDAFHEQFWDLITFLAKRISVKQRTCACTSMMTSQTWDSTCTPSFLSRSFREAITQFVTPFQTASIFAYISFRMGSGTVDPVLHSRSRKQNWVPISSTACMHSRTNPLTSCQHGVMSFAMSCVPTGLATCRGVTPTLWLLSLHNSQMCTFLNCIYDH
jgi:hypothetical protein